MDLSTFFRIARAAVFLLTLAFLASCATLQLRQGDSPLPVEVDSSAAGLIRATAWESKDELFVSGSFKMNSGIKPLLGAKILVELLDSDSKVLASGYDRLPPTLARRRASGRASMSFVVSFPLGEARQASLVRVSFLEKKWN